MKVYCNNCRHKRRYPNQTRIRDYCAKNARVVDTPLQQQVEFEHCIFKNMHNDCKDYEEKPRCKWSFR